MVSNDWNKESIAALQKRVLRGELHDFAGFETRDELCLSLAAVAESDDPDIRGSIMRILYRLDREKTFALLVHRLHDEDHFIRSHAVELLAWYGERTTPYLIPLLAADPSPIVRCNAAGILGYFGTSEALAPLKQAAEVDEGVDLKGFSVKCLARRAIKQIKARTKPGAPPYDPWAPRSLKMEMEIDEQEDESI